MIQLDRYSRQILFQPIGEEGQKRLLNGRVAIVGIGALGTVIANHLVRSGVGNIRLIDRDVVEYSNLQRQTLFNEEDARLHLPKAIAASRILTSINSSIEIDSVITDLNLDNAEELLGGFDCIVDGTDNFMTRYLINDVAVKHNIPWIYGGAVSSRGMYAVIKPNQTPCFRCLFPHAPTNTGETCDMIGVLSPITDIIGSFQAIETIKLLAGAKTNSNLEQLDIWNNSSLQMDISKGRNPKCPTCGERNFEFLDRSSHFQVSYVSLCGRDTVQINPRQKMTIDFMNLPARLMKNGKVSYNEFLIRFSPDNENTMVIFKDGRVLVHGTNDISKAKILYSKYMGS
ncbi:MAG: ThiF family adenylyltransferase [Bacillota bacterium]|nr:ThiF family adenylyltransferase [Bacillota bacterium]